MRIAFNSRTFRLLSIRGDRVARRWFQEEFVRGCAPGSATTRLHPGKDVRAATKGSGFTGRQQGFPAIASSGRPRSWPLSGCRPRDV